jgi:hypothetical protein
MAYRTGKACGLIAASSCGMASGIRARWVRRVRPFTHPAEGATWRRPHNQALNALVFLYREVIGGDLE